MKKKILAALLAAAMALSITACGDSSETNKEEAKTEDTGENKDVVEPEKEEFSTKEYSGLSFNIPSDVEYSESDSIATINFEPKKKIAVIVPTDMSELGELADVYEALAVSSALNAYEEVQNREDFDMTVSGVSAKAATATVKLSGSWFSLSVVSFINENTQQQYSISYLVDESADEDHSDYEAFIKSITFN